MILSIEVEDKCWGGFPGCGVTDGITKAHVIPQAMKPEQNLTIPLCRNCHTKLDRKIPNKEQFHNLLQGIKSRQKGISDNIEKLEEACGND